MNFNAIARIMNLPMGVVIHAVEGNQEPINVFRSECVYARIPDRYRIDICWDDPIDLVVCS
jgi:hypothetical protein